MEPNTRKRLSGVAVALAFWLATAAQAATLTAMPVDEVILTATSTTVMITLDLAPGELVSVFEGHFDMVGLGVVASAVLDAGGPSWPAGSSFGSIAADRAIVSLTSANDGGNRLVAAFEVTGLSPGVFEIVYNNLSFAAFDIAGPPFLQDMPLTNTHGMVLARITVVPVPAAVVLLGPALLLLVGMRRGH